MRAAGFVAAFALALPCAAADMTVSGLTLGETPVGLGPCPNPGAIVPIVDSPCMNRAEFVGGNKNWFSADLALPLRDRPRIVSGTTAKILLRDARLVAFDFSTSGVQTQEADLRDLIAKYGEPTQKRVVEVGNRLGARFESIEATWLLDGLTVVYASAVGRLDYGQVLISTPAADDLRKARSAELDKLLNPRKL